LKIKDCTYKGFDYQILFADRGDWGKHLNHFHTECEHNFTGDFGKTLEEVDKKIKLQIDNFLSTIPDTVEQLIEAIEDQLVWTDYEDCHLDTETTRHLITGFLKKRKAH